MLSLVSRVITSAYNRSVPGGQTATSGVAMEETKQWLIQTDLLGPWMPAEIVALGTVFFQLFYSLIHFCYLFFYFASTLPTSLVEWQFSLVNNVVGRINEVNQRRVWLVLGQMTFSVCNQLPRSTQPLILPRKWMLVCLAGVKDGTRLPVLGGK